MKITNSFRPLQGLTIMNLVFNYFPFIENRFPSPTGVNHYEYECDDLYHEDDMVWVSVPYRG